MSVHSHPPENHDLPPSDSEPEYGRVPASLLRDPKITPNAKMLYAMLDANRDINGHPTLVGLRGHSHPFGVLVTPQALYELVVKGWARVELLDAPFGEGEA